MSSTEAMEKEIRTTTLDGLTERLSQRPIVAGLGSGVLLWSAFPPVEWSWLAWIALVPLFWLGIQQGRVLRLYLGAWAGGLVFWLLSVQWVRLTDATAWLAWLAMALIFSLWWPGFVALARLAVFRLRLPLMVAAPFSGSAWNSFGPSFLQASLGSISVTASFVS